jgi:hypothetical protein
MFLKKKKKEDNKLTPKYYGPYKVLQRIESMDYKIGVSSIFTCTYSLPFFLLKEGNQKPYMISNYFTID